MAQPTQAQVDKMTVNLDRWDRIVNGGPTETVILDTSTVKTIEGYLNELKTFVVTGDWLTATSYIVKDLAKESGNWYTALEPHTSGVFATDLAAGRWALHQIDFSSNVSLIGDFSVDSPTFVINSTTNRVGVGTSAPDSLFQANGRVAVVEANGDITSNIAQAFAEDEQVVSRGGFIAYRDAAADATFISGLVIANINNASDTGGATSKAIAAIAARTVTSDGNFDDDSGADLLFFAKVEAGNVFEGMILTSEGSIGIGTSTPDERVEIAGGDLEISSISSGTGTAVVVDANGKILKDSSSRRYKKDIEAVDIGGVDLSLLQPVFYNRRIFNHKAILGEDDKVVGYEKIEDEESSGGRELGLIAEDVHAILPEIIIYDNDGNPDSVRYDKLSLYLLAVLQKKGII